MSTRPTYDEIGATLRGDLPAGFHHDRYARALSDRPDAYELAIDGLRRWVAHRGAGMTVEPSDPPVDGATVAIAVPVGPITAIAPCRIVEVVREEGCFGFAYGTLPGHPERGEEAFVVERRDGAAAFVVTAFSRPAEPLARLGGPLTRWIQRAKTKRYLDALADFVERAS